MYSIAPFLNRAQSAVKEARFIEACEFARAHILSHPQSFRAWSILGTIAIKDNDIDRAIICFRRAMQVTRDFDPRIAMNFGRALVLSKQIVFAKNIFETVLLGTPTHYPAHFELARLHLEAMQFDKAAPHLNALAKTAPINWPRLDAMRKQLTSLADCSAALPFLATLAVRRGDDASLWAQLFQFELSLEPSKTTAVALRRSLLLYPRGTPLLTHLTMPHLVQGAEPEMLSLFRAVASTVIMDDVGLLRWAYFFKNHDNVSGEAMVLASADRLQLKHPRFAPFRAWMFVKNGQRPALAALVNSFVGEDCDDIIAWNDLGLVIRSVNDSGETSKFFRRAHRRFPHQMELQHNLAQAETDDDNIELGRRLSIQILVREPCSLRTLNLLGILEGELEKPEIAKKILRRCLLIKPNWPTALHNLGLQLSLCGDSKAAIDTFRNALAYSNGDYPEASYNLGLELMGTGEIAEGFDYYRMRWKTDGFLSPHRPLFQTEWPGPLAAPRSNLAIFMEQGMGDEVMYSWYLPWVAADTESLTVECDGRLMPIFRRSFPKITFVAREDPISKTLSVREIEYKTAIGSVPQFYADPLKKLIQKQQVLPRIFGKRHKPRLEVNTDRLAHWRQYLRTTFGDRPCLGVVWRSAFKTHKRNKQYLTPSQLIAALPPFVGIVNLQYSYNPEEAEEFSRLGSRYNLQFETPPGIDLKEDLDDLFALIQSLDGVVGPLISVPWMAAAVGTPAFVFRTAARGNIWQQLNTPHVPWAPSMRLFFRSPTAPWETVLETVKRTLIRELF